MVGWLLPASAARVDLSNDGPAVVGAPIMFTATVILDHDDERPDQLIYEWSDNASPRHYNKVWLTTVWGRYKLGLAVTRQRSLSQCRCPA